MYHSNRFLSIEDLLARAELQPNGCYNWTGRVDEDGYGRFKVNGKSIGVHRRVAIMAHGEPQAHQIAMHLCDNPPCINPNHLRWGTQLENQRDKVAKNRQAKGRHHGRSIYTQEQVDGVIAMKQAGHSNAEIMQAHQVPKWAIYRFYANDK